MKILIATPCNQGLLTMGYVTSLLTKTINHPERLKNLTRYDIGTYICEGNSGLGKDRSVMASHALRNGIEKLIFIDADQMWEWEDIRKIIDSPQKIIAGVVPLKSYSPGTRPNFMHLPKDQDCFDSNNKNPTPGGLDKLYTKYNSEEVEVAAVGTAFLCIDHDVLAKLSTIVEPFLAPSPGYKQVHQCWEFFQSGVLDGVYLGEDWNFCRQAKACGFPIFINTTVRIPHIGNHVYKLGNELYNEQGGIG